MTHDVQTGRTTTPRAPESGAASSPVPRASYVQSVDRAMVLLAAVADSASADATAQLLGERTGLNRATVFRILTTLESHDMVVRDERTGQWSIGTGAVRIARAVGLDALTRSARAVLNRLSLQTGEVAAFALEQGGELVYAAEVIPPGSELPSWVGHAAPLHATSTGKAYLAMTDPAEVPALLGTRLVRFTDATVVDPAVLLAELERVRERGYAECRGEHDERSWGVSSAVLDASRRPVGVLSVWGPRSRVSPARFEALGALARDAAGSLSWR